MPPITKEYIINLHYNGIHPTCKCGCGTQLSFKPLKHGPWFSQYTKNHAPKKAHTQETKEKIGRGCKSHFIKKYGVENPFQSAEVKEKIKKTNLERYGVENPAQNKKIKEKIKETNLTKYGVKNPFQNLEVQEKAKKTNLGRYGVEYPTQNKKVRDKVKETNLERYGVENPAQNSDIMDKVKKTNLGRYGVECSSQNLEVQEKAKKTNLERLGVEYSTQNPEVIQKQRETNMEKFGVNYPTQNPDIMDKLRETNLERYGVECSSQNLEVKKKFKKTIYNRFRTLPKYTDKLTPLFSEDDYKGSHNTYPFECMECHTQFDGMVQNGLVPKCPSCFPPSESTPEREVREFIQSIYSDEIVQNTRSIIAPRELDIYLPELKLGIELNGVYWHSEVGGGKDRRYHLDKTEACEKAGVKLLHIMDVEWETKQDIIKTILTRYVASHTLRKTGARQTTVRQVGRDESNAFLENYHLQGGDRSTHRYGLYLEGELVSVMTFGKSRFDKKISWEMIRYCERGDGYVVGGANKLFKAFIRDASPESVVTYADRRFFTGLVYSKLGFEFVENTPTNYSYFRLPFMVLESRQKYQKHKLAKKLETFNPDLTEWENMQLNGYDRIWDCGHTKWEFQLP